MSDFDFLRRIKLDLPRLLFYEGNYKQWNHPNTFQPFMTIYVILEGDAYVDICGKRIQFIPGYSYLLPANISMGLGCETHIKKIWGHFQVQTTIGFDLMTSWEQFVIIERAFLPSTIKKMSDVELYFFVKSKIWQGVSQESEYFEKAIQNFSFKTKWEKIVLEYMDKELDAQSRVQDLAKLVNMSSDGLSRSFQKRYGISLKKYMLGQLNQKVCMSLMQPSMPIKEVAKLYNFQDEHYFYQFFKKHNLQTPKKFRISQGL